MPNCIKLTITSVDVPKLILFYKLLGIDFREYKLNKQPTRYIARIDNLILEIKYVDRFDKNCRDLKLSFVVPDIAKVICNLTDNFLYYPVSVDLNSVNKKIAIFDPEVRLVTLVESENTNEQDENSNFFLE